MFGMLSPARHSLAYRATYARCCQHHRRVNGISALPWLSYEAVLLYQVAADAGAVRVTDLPQVRCCKLRPLPAKTDDRDVGTFCAHMGSLLASIKVSDDRRDGGGLRSRLLGWLYRRRFAASRAYFRRFDSNFEARVEGFVRDHLRLERPGVPIDLTDYTGPTGAAFGYVFALMARLLATQGHEGLLRSLGERIGAAIIAFDCAADRDRDRRRGDFNPLPDGPEAIQIALALSGEKLRLARCLCEDAFGPGSLAAQTLRGVSDRVSNVGRRLACPRCGEEMRSALQGRGSLTWPGSVQLASAFGLATLWASGPSPPPPPEPSPAPAPTPAPEEAPAEPIQQAVACSSGGCAPCPNSFDSCVCCGECGGCALDAACDSMKGDSCGDCGGCDGCGGCDCN